MKKAYDELPNRIKEWRNKRRMSLAELGEIVNLSRSEISKLENGSRRVRSDHLLKLSKALRIRPEDLLSKQEAEELLNHTAEIASENPSSATTMSMSMDLPVCGQMTETTFMVDEETPQTFSQRPPQLDRVAGAYAVHVPSTDLEPHVRVGTLLYVNPVLPARPEDLAVIRYTSGKQADVVYVMRDNSTGQLVGKKYGQEETTIDLAANDVKAVHRVVGSWYS